MTKIYRTVLLPIKVPDCDFCMENKEPFWICEHLNTRNSLPRCSLGVGAIWYRNNAIPKPVECMNLAKA